MNCIDLILLPQQILAEEDQHGRAALRCGTHLPTAQSHAAICIAVFNGHSELGLVAHAGFDGGETHTEKSRHFLLRHDQLAEIFDSLEIELNLA